nr:hypothetical protein [Paracoccus saliphilus]
MNRRQILTATLPAAMAAAYVAGAQAAGATPAPAEEVTPIMALFREWQGLRIEEEAIYAASPTGEDEATKAISERTHQLECRVMAERCHDARDFVAKMMVWTVFGLNTLPDEEADPELWAEARALVAA